MKRILLGIFALSTMSALNAQIEIQHDGAGPNVAGTIIEMNVDQFTPTPYQPKFYVTNNTGSDQQWRITRVKQNAPTTWTDQICWPPQCYNASGDTYLTPSSQGTPAPTIENGTHMTTDGAIAELKGQIFPDGNNGAGLYMYYITDMSGNYLDSVGVQVNFVLGVEENTSEIAISAAPNPANSYINIQAEGAEGGTITLLDVLGNVVLTERLTSSSKSINTENFRNGVYFIRIEGDGLRTSNRKIIIRH